MEESARIANEVKEKKPKEVTVTVNRVEVTLEDRDVTGLEIKQAAIGQGVPDVDASFELVLVKGKEQHPVADDQVLKLHPNEKFLMLRPDHNS